MQTELFIKTDRGRREITERAYRLSQRLRIVLVAVDGRRSVAALEAELGAIVDVRRSIRYLTDGRFIAPALLHDRRTSAARE